MSKTLFLLRHAKAMTGGVLIADQDRVLADRGIKDAKELASRLLKKDVKFDLILSSPAIRAITTAQIIAKGLDISARSYISVDDVLYGAEVMGLLKVISDVSKKIDKLLVVGHNPGLMNLVSFLAGEPVSMSTCSLIKFSFDFKNWHEIFTTKPTKFSFIN